MKNNDVQDIFISYRRDGGDSYAMLLYDRLIHAGYRVFLDVESLNSGKFNEVIFSKIHACTDVIVVLPPNALDRCENKDDWVRLEIECALESKKNIIPMMLRGFSWPNQLPESIAELPKCNGVSVDSTELIDGVMIRLQTKLLKSKPCKKPLSEDESFSRRFHRLQFLLECGDSDELNELLEQMENDYPDRPEIYLSKMQVYFNISDWKQLGQQNSEFASYPEWKFAYRIASPELKAEMERILQEYGTFCKKEKEKQARQAALIKKEKEEKRLLAMEAIRQKEEETRRKKEEIRQKRINQVRPAYEKAMQQYEQLKWQPVLPAQYELLCETRVLLDSIGNLIDTSEAREFCENRIKKITESAEAKHEKTFIVLYKCGEEEFYFETIISKVLDFFSWLPPFSGTCRKDRKIFKIILYLPFYLLLAVPAIISKNKKHFKEISWPYLIKKTNFIVADKININNQKSTYGDFYLNADQRLGIWPSISRPPLSWNDKNAILNQFSTKSRVVLLPTGHIAWLDSQNKEKTIENLKLIAYSSARHGRDIALLEDGRIVLFHDDEKFKVYNCPASEKIIQDGVSNLPLNASKDVLTKYQKKASKRFITKKQRQKYRRNVLALEEVINIAQGQQDCSK